MELPQEQLKKLEAYLMETMSNREREIFQKEIDASSELQEFISLYHNINILEDEGQWPIKEVGNDRVREVLANYRNEETVAFSEKVKHLRTDKSNTNFPQKAWYRPAMFAAIAACLALLVYISLPQEADMMALYKTHSTWNELPSMVMKGDATEVEKVAVEQAFNEKDFEKTILLSSKIIKEATGVQPGILLYDGVAHLELNQFDEALKSFDFLLQSNSIDNHKGYWYKALTYLKMGDKERTINALKLVVSDPTNYRSNEAANLLDELD